MLGFWGAGAFGVLGFCRIGARRWPNPTEFLYFSLAWGTAVPRSFKCVGFRHPGVRIQREFPILRCIRARHRPDRSLPSAQPAFCAWPPVNVRSGQVGARTQRDSSIFRWIGTPPCLDRSNVLGSGSQVYEPNGFCPFCVGLRRGRARIVHRDLLSASILRPPATQRQASAPHGGPKEGWVCW